MSTNLGNIKVGLNHSFQNHALRNWLVNPLTRNRDLSMNQNCQVYAICAGPELVGDVISAARAKTSKSHRGAVFEVTSFSKFSRKSISAIWAAFRQSSTKKMSHDLQNEEVTTS